jgi:hypothetical protein
MAYTMMGKTTNTDTIASPTIFMTYCLRPMAFHQESLITRPGMNKSHLIWDLLILLARSVSGVEHNDATLSPPLARNQAVT